MIAIVDSCFRYFILFAFKTEVHLESVLLKAKYITCRLLLLNSVTDKLTFLRTSVKILLDRTISLSLSRFFIFGNA